MIVVSDASPLMNLAAIDLLDILPPLFSSVLIPPTVYEEIVVIGAGKPGAAEVQSADWIQVQSCEDVSLVQRLQEELDPGEAEAIALAYELNADVLLIDESAGRSIARSYHLSIVGLLGILLSAKEKGLIEHVKNPIERLENEAQFYISQSLKEEVLRMAGE